MTINSRSTKGQILDAYNRLHAEHELLKAGGTREDIIREVHERIRKQAVKSAIEHDMCDQVEEALREAGVPFTGDLTLTCEVKIRNVDEFYLSRDYGLSSDNLDDHDFDDLRRVIIDQGRDATVKVTSWTFKVDQ